MRRIIITTFALVLTTVSLQAQRFAYVDMQYILENLPEYQEAQTQLDNIAEGWRAEVSTKMDEVDQMYRQFQAEQVLLTEPMKRQRIEAIEQKEREVKEYQKSKFGPEGELFERRQQLIKPIQDRVYDAIQELAREKGYDVIFDKSGEVMMLFTNDRYDKSADILDKLTASPAD